MKHPLRNLVMCSVVVLASACASSVAGTAEIGPAGISAVTAPSSPGPQSFPDPSVPAESSAPESVPPESSAPEESSPTEAPATSTPATSTRSTTAAPTTSRSVSRLTKLDCPAGALIPSARTFCYQIPSGFVDGSSTATYPGTDPVESAIQIKGTGRTRDLIFVTSTVLDINADNLSDAVIKASLTKAFASNTSAASTAAIKQSTVAGDRAFETTIKFTDGVQQRYLIVFAGFTRVSVSCQWQDQTAAIAAGCTSVLRSLQIKNP